MVPLMRIISIGDIHMSAKNIYNIKEAETADLIILNGDITNYGSSGDAKSVLDTILSVNQNVLAQFANLDKPELNDYLEELNINLHNQARLVNNRVCLLGVGGSNQTPFGTPTEFSEQELHQFVENGYNQATTFIGLAEPIEKIKIPLILVSHVPPEGTAVDTLRSGKHVGSKAIRRFIEDKQPDLCISGHIHEATGMDMIGSTPIYNPGMFRNGGWLEILINKSKITVTLHD